MATNHVLRFFPIEPYFEIYHTLADSCWTCQSIAPGALRHYNKALYNSRSSDSAFVKLFFPDSSICSNLVGTSTILP